MHRFWILGLVLWAGCGGGSSNSTDFAKGEVTRCLVRSGDTTARCVDEYIATVTACRLDADTSCEPAARAEGGALEAVLSAVRDDNLDTCTDEQTFTLGYFGGGEDLASKAVDACKRFGEGLLDMTFSQAAGPMSGPAKACQAAVSSALADLRSAVVQAVGPDCSVIDFDRNGCDRRKRDNAMADAQSRAQEAILTQCGADFDSLRLASLGPSLEERVDDLLERVVDRSRNLALFAYPPNNIGATAEFGSFPIGVRTYQAVDASRPNVPGDGPRPVTFDVYYPSTPDAVAGVPEDIASVLGIEILPTPAFRDVQAADGVFPVVLFSHGFEGIRFQSFFHLAHLASHGFIVVSPDHHGNTIPDGIAGIIDEHTAVNRAFDMKFVMDQILDPSTPAGAEFAASIDPDRIGMSGHSYGGYEAFILTGGEVSGTSLEETTATLGTFTDPRIKAILPMAPRTMHRVDAVTLDDSYFHTVTVPTLIIGSELDMTDPFFTNAMRAFDNLPVGSEFVGLAEVLDGGHTTFTDLCELQSEVLDVVGGADEGCMPRHLPWKYAHDLINYLTLNFFDGVLNGNTEALDRLDPAVVGELEDLKYWRK